MGSIESEYRRLSVWVVAAVCALFLLLDAGPAFAQEEQSTVARFVDGIAELTFRYAWPTATYESLECCDAERADGDGLNVSFTLHGRSAFGGGPLWTEVVIAVSPDWQITDLHFGRNNAILAQPGETMGAIGQVLLSLNAQAQRGSGAPDPSAPADSTTTPVPAPPPAEPQVEPPPPPPSVETPVAAADSPPPNAGARANTIGALWSFRINLEYASAGKDITPAGATPSANGTGQPNGLRFVLGHLEAFRMMPLAPWAYVGVGVDAGIGQAQGGRCTETPVCVGHDCTCPGDFASWHGFAGEYGVAGKLLLTTIPAPGTSTFSLAVPTLRIEHLLSNVSSTDAKCGGILGTCHGLSADNVAVSAEIEFDWTEFSHGSVSGGCGIGGGVLGVFGGIADSDHTHYAWFIRGGPHLEIL